jgi:hypothetical protein
MTSILSLAKLPPAASSTLLQSEIATVSLGFLSARKSPFVHLDEFMDPFVQPLPRLSRLFLVRNFPQLHPAK